MKSFVLILVWLLTLILINFIRKNSLICLGSSIIDTDLQTAKNTKKLFLKKTYMSFSLPRKGKNVCVICKQVWEHSKIGSVHCESWSNEFLLHPHHQDIARPFLNQCPGHCSKSELKQLWLICILPNADVEVRIKGHWQASLPMHIASDVGQSGWPHFLKRKRRNKLIKSHFANSLWMCYK